MATENAETNSVSRLEHDIAVMDRLGDMLFQRIDGWNNILTGAGIRGKDPLTAYRAHPNSLTETVADNLYLTDDNAARIVDRMAEEMTRAGFTLTIEGDDGTLSNNVMSRWDNLNLDKKMADAIKLARLHGGAGIVLGVMGSSSLEQPLIPKAVRNLAFLTVLNRYQLTAVPETIETNPINENFGLPNLYTINVLTSGEWKPRQTIHYSRILRFVGIEVPPSRLSQYGYWGDSVLSRLQEVLAQYQAAFHGLMGSLRNSDRLIFKMEDLAELIAQGEDEKVMRRISLLATTWSSLNIAVLQSNESLEALNSQYAGLGDLIKNASMRLVAASGMPHTLVLGDSPSGLGATGESELRNWYDYVRNRQEVELRPNIRKIIDIILSTFKRGALPNYTIEFNPLWQPTEKELAETRKIIAETDSAYLDRDVLGASEIRASRFGGNTFSSETVLNEDPSLELAQEDPQLEGN